MIGICKACGRAVTEASLTDGYCGMGCHIAYEAGRNAMRAEVMSLVESILFDGSGSAVEFVHAVECLR